MNYLTSNMVLCVAACFVFACGSEGDSSSISPDATVPLTPDGAMGEPPIEPDIGAPDTPSDFGVSDEPDAEIPADAETVPVLSCDTFAEDHLYRQSAESFADYETREMCDYRGETLLIVNTAAKCGYTPQYEGLSALDERYGDRGFTILGFLSNDFGNQAGTQDEVEACNSEHRVLFEQFTPISVVSGSSQHPIFRWLTNQPGLEGEIEWNFGKFLVSADGVLLARWASALEPEDEQVITAIENALDAQAATE
jgi:glutathione peroxidase